MARHRVVASLPAVLVLVALAALGCGEAKPLKVAERSRPASEKSAPEESPSPPTKPPPALKLEIRRETDGQSSSRTVWIVDEKALAFHGATTEPPTLVFDLLQRKWRNCEEDKIAGLEQAQKSAEEARKRIGSASWQIKDPEERKLVRAPIEAKLAASEADGRLTLASVGSTYVITPATGLPEPWIHRLAAYELLSVYRDAMIAKESPLVPVAALNEMARRGVWPSLVELTNRTVAGETRTKIAHTVAEMSDAEAAKARALLEKYPPPPPPEKKKPQPSPFSEEAQEAAAAEESAEPE